MAIALITAGGMGTRISQSTTPKQFMPICGMPAIVHTLKTFQNHPEIDTICIACLDGWQDEMHSYIKKHDISKLKHIVDGGTTNQESIFNCLTELKKHYDDNEIVLIHDGVRILVSDRIISDCIKTTREHGNAIAFIPATEAVLVSTDNKTANQSIPRDNLKRTQTPHGFKLGDIYNAHQTANQMGISNTVAGCTLMIELGQPVHLYPGAERNLKITTDEDIHIARTFLKEQQQCKTSEFPNMKKFFTYWKKIFMR